MILTIPVPPSVNGAWRNVPGKGRVRTGAYKTWATAAGWAVKAQHPGAQPMLGDLSVSIRIKRPRKGCDVDNRIKPILDLLTSMSIIGDDSQVVRVSCEWADVEGAVVEIKEVKP